MVSDAEIFLFAIVILPPIFMFLFLLYLDYTGNKKAKVLYFETESVCRLLSTPVKDGEISIKDKVINVDEVKPATMPSGIIIKSMRPLYIVKWDKALPFKFTEKGIEIISGGTLKSLIENKTLKQLLTPQSSNSQMFMFLLIGTIVGGLVGYLLGGGLKA